VASALDHVLQEPTLDRIIVDDKNVGRHWNLLAGPRVMRRVGTIMMADLGRKG
jgi:hypothetical protein